MSETNSIKDLIVEEDVNVNVGDSLLVGPDGPVGPEGPQGPEGKSAYEVAVENGFTGTEEEWLASLKAAIDDSKTATDTTWSSEKISEELEPINNYKALELTEIDGLMVAIETGLLYKNPSAPNNGHILYGNIIKNHEYKVNVLKKGDRFRIYLYNEYKLEDIKINNSVGNLVFDDPTKMEAVFNSQQYNFAIIMLSNTTALYNQKECAEILNSDYKYDIERETYIKSILNKDITELNTKIFDIDINDENLWEVGNIDNYTGELTNEDENTFIRTKDFISSDVYRIRNRGVNNARLFIYNNETSEFIESIILSSTTEDFINLKMDKKYKIKYNKDLIPDPLYINLYTISDYNKLEANSEELNTRVENLEANSEELNTRVENLEANSEELNTELFDTDINKESLWELGSINYATGALEDNNSTIRTKDFVDSNIIKVIKNLENPKVIGVRIYDLEESFYSAFELTDTAILDTDSYKYKFIIKSNTVSDFTALKLIKEKNIDKYLDKEPFIFPDWVKWKDTRYSYGFNKNLQSIFKTVQGVLESDTMISVRGGKGRWNKTDRPDSTFVSGGHLFEGWSGNELSRLTMLIGKFHETFACIQTYSPKGLYESNRRFGWIKLGSDDLYKGVDFSQGWTKFYTPLTLQNLSSAPTGVSDSDLNPQLSQYNNSIPIGTVYYDTTLKKLRLYTDEGWKNLMFE